MSVNQKRILGLLLLVAGDLLSVWGAVLLGFRLRFGLFGRLPRFYEQNLVYYILILALAALMANALLGCYGSIWRYFGYRDVFRLAASVLLMALFVILIDNFIGLEMPLEMFILIPVLIFGLMLLLRSLPRIGRAVRAKLRGGQNASRPVKTLIYGAGEAGNYLLLNLKRRRADVLPVGFLDDDESLWGKKLGGVLVRGGGKQLEYVLRDCCARELIIAIPTATDDFIKDVYLRCQRIGVVVKRYGRLSDVTDEDFQNAPIKQVNFEELLRRDSVRLNMGVVGRFLQGRRVLVTGGAGSIGSEICRQALGFGAASLVIFDIDENGLFHLKNELEQAGYAGRFEMRLGSVRDRARLREVFREYRPETVFHAAAHKHVPMMEENPLEAVKNNILGTVNVANEAVLHSVGKFILISTDKAVNPTNVMGASKRVAEIAVQIMNQAGDTDFAAVRFGNVLGSNGSVVPFFEKQIEQGGPVTVTHRRMKRYFMTIPEAVQLVLEAGAMATGGEIFVLDMGEPVYIYDLACDLIRMHGLEPGRDVKIEITGPRPGEKLFEEISLAEEDTEKTPNNKIFINKPVAHDAQLFARRLHRLQEACASENREEMFRILAELVPTFCREKNRKGN